MGVAGPPSTSRPAPWRRLGRGAAYAVFVVAFVISGLELFARSGMLTSAHSRAAEGARGGRGQVRVLILGDSFALEGRPQAPRAAEILRRYLEKRQVSVLNLAVGGFGPRDYQKQFRTWGEIYAPHLVLLFYYVGNDISDTKVGRRPFAPSAVLPLGDGALGSAQRWLARAQGWSAVAPVIGDALGELRWARRRHQFHVSLEQGTYQIVPDKRDYFSDSLLIRSAAAHEAWETNKKLIADIAGRAGRWGARLLVVICPATFQINRSNYNFYRRLGLTMDEDMLLTSRPQQLFLAFCGESGLQCLDLLPAFRGAADEYYLENDDHWNERGHRLAFELVRARLEAGDLLSVRSPGR